MIADSIRCLLAWRTIVFCVGLILVHCCGSIIAEAADENDWLQAKEFSQDLEASYDKGAAYSLSNPDSGLQILFVRFPGEAGYYWKQESAEGKLSVIVSKPDVCFEVFQTKENSTRQLKYLDKHDGYLMRITRVEEVVKSPWAFVTIPINEIFGREFVQALGIAARPEASATKLRFEFKHPEKGWVKVSKAALPFQASPAGVTLDFDSSRPGRIIAWDEGVVSSVIYTGSIKYVSDIE